MWKSKVGISRFVVAGLIALACAISGGSAGELQKILDNSKAFAALPAMKHTPTFRLEPFQPVQVRPEAQGKQWWYIYDGDEQIGLITTWLNHVELFRFSPDVAKGAKYAIPPIYHWANLIGTRIPLQMSAQWSGLPPVTSLKIVFTKQRGDSLEFKAEQEHREGYRGSIECRLGWDERLGYVLHFTSHFAMATPKQIEFSNLYAGGVSESRDDHKRWQKTVRGRLADGRISFVHHKQKNDLFAIVGRDAAHWEYPDSSIHPRHLTPGVNAEIHFVDEPGEHAYYRIPVARAVRHWLLAVGDKREWTKLRYPGSHQTAYPYLAHLRTKVCDLPLDKVKDWHLDWEQKLLGQPRLFFSPEQGQALLRRIEGHEPFKPYLAQVERILTGQQGAKTVGGVGAHTGGNMVELLLRVGYSGFVQSISIVRPMRGVAEQLDYNARTLDPEQVARTRREMAFLTSVVTDGDYWQYAWNQGRTSYLPNFGSDLYVAVGLMALVLPDHPNSKQWLSYALGELDKELTYYISPDGAGEENIANYYLWTWRQLTVLFGALKHNGIFDAARHPRYQAACRFWIEILTPPQPKLAAFASSAPIRPEDRLRRIPPFGDHGFNDNVCLEQGGATGILKETNPQLASECAWAWREACGARPATQMGALPHVLIADPTVAPRVPVLKSRQLRGFGAVLRNHFPSDKETFLAIKASRIYSHHHPDEGGIHLFGRGVPIILDGLHGKDYYREQWHPIVTFADGKTHRRGEVVDFSTSPLADFVAADIPVGPFLPGPPEPGMTRNGSRRHVLLVKSPTLDVPDYFVLQDIVYGPAASQLNLPVFCGKPQPGAGGKANWVLLPPIDSPNHGVATDLVFLWPAAPDITVTPIPNGEGGEHAWAVSARQPAGKNWAVIVYPRDKQMAPPTVALLDSPNAFRLTSPGGLATDYVVCAAGAVSTQTDEFRFTGYCGVARLRNDRVSVSLVNGTEIRCRDIGVFGKGPASLTQTATGFTGTAEGPQRSIYLILGRQWTSDLMLTLNGKREKRNSPNGILAIDLPEGTTEFTIQKP